jgi:predicted nucleic acid-binding protein
VPIVVDASVVLAWQFEDEVSEYADRALDLVSQEGAAVPSVWPVEVANGLYVAERRGRLSAAKLARAVELIEELPVFVRDIALAEVLGPVLDLARAHGLTAYDASYLELAMREGLPLATQDDDMRAAAARAGVPLVT